MEDNKYLEKEIVIFDGLIKLMKEGANPYLIKVSDIAKAANIGKGTIYDYFDTKEEVISKAIIYSMSKEIQNAITRIRAKDKFKERFFEILELIELGLEKPMSILNILLSAGGIEKFYEYLTEKEGKISKFIILINKEIEELLKLGKKEGKINTNENYFYQIMAVMGIVSFFSHYIKQKNIYKDISSWEAKDIAYRILLKSLN
jgi:hypothetical protein